jgi:hypothetical protein
MFRIFCFWKKVHFSEYFSFQLYNNLMLFKKFKVRVTLLGVDPTAINEDRFEMGLWYQTRRQPVPVAARSEAWVCGWYFDGPAGSNTTRGMEVCLLWMLCSVRYRRLRRTDPLSKGVLPSVCVCVSVCLSVSLSVVRRNNNSIRLQWVGGRGPTEKERKNEWKKERKRERKKERRK